MTQTPILEAILHPPLGILQRELVTGLFSGSGDLTRPAAAPPPFNHVNAYGLSWTFFTVPVGYGRDLWQPQVFDRAMMRLGTVHTDIAGHDLFSEWHDFYSDGIYWLWNNPGPTRIHYDISPGVEVTFYWLLI